MERLPIDINRNSKLLVLRENEVRSLTAFFNSFESTLTKREYTAASREFLSLVSKHIGELSELSRDHVISYQAWLRSKGRSRNTINKKISAISSLCKHLAFEGICDKDLTYGVKRPPATNKRETADFTNDEIKRIFATLNPRLKFYTSHRAILAVGFYTGLRSREIRTLKIKNIGEVAGHRVLNLVIKGGKPLEVPLTPFAYNALAEHLRFLAEKYKIDTEDKEQWVFPSLGPTFKNEPITASGLRAILNTKLKQAGIPISSIRRYSPHSMRASIAGHLLNDQEVPLEQVQKLLGHSSPATTQRYNKRITAHDKSPVYKIEY